MIDSFGHELLHILQNPSDLLPRVAQWLGEKLQVDLCFISSPFFREDGKILESKQGLWCRQYPISQGLLREFLEQNKLKSSSLLSIPSPVPEFPQMWGLLLQGDGQLLLGRTKQSESLPEPKWPRGLSAILALALSQIQLQKQVQQKYNHQQLINELTHTIRNAHEVEFILNSALTSIAQTMAVDWGMILMVKYEDPLTLKNRQSLNIPPARVSLVSQVSTPIASQFPLLKADKSGLLSFWLAECPLCFIAWQEAPSPLVLASPDHFPAIYNPEINILPQIKETAALLITPLLGTTTQESDRPLVLGFMILQQHEPRCWQPDEIELATWVSNQISTAILHKHTLQQVQSLVEERTAQLRKSLDVQAKLYEKTRQQVQQLRQLLQLKDEFLDSVSHELKTPLTTMKVAIGMLRQPKLSVDRRTKYLDLLEQEWHRENNLIQDLLTLQKLESHQFEFQPQEVNLNELTNQLQAAFREKWFAKGLILQIDNFSENYPLLIYTDLDILQRILQELLTNAGKYADANTTVELTLDEQSNDTGNRVVLAITNFGPGIPPEEQQDIFEKFTRGKGVTASAVPGTGLGLALVKSFLQQINGSIELSCQAVANTSQSKICFTVTLPQSVS